MIYYATVRRKKDIISLLCCADNFASFARVSLAASNSNPQIRRSVSERRATKVLLKVTLTCKRETFFTAIPSDTEIDLYNMMLN